MDDPQRADLIALVESVRRLPYGRPSDRSVAGMLREGRGTCSTKHLHLARELERRCPETRPKVVHRVYRIDAGAAGRAFGPPWDGRSSMPLACGPGDDHPAGADPDADKRTLEARHCDPAVREQFIAALGRSPHPTSRAAAGAMPRIHRCRPHLRG